MGDLSLVVCVYVCVSGCVYECSMLLALIRLVALWA